MVWALEKVEDVQHNQAVFLDIGANLGAYTLAIAALGYDVIAFEGLARNQLAVYTSLCACPDLAERVTLFPVALGGREMECTFFSGTDNAGACLINSPNQVHSGSRAMPRTRLTAASSQGAFVCLDALHCNCTQAVIE